MATAQRVFWETVAVIVFVVLLVLAWFASGFRAGRQMAAAEANQQRILAEQAAIHEEELARIRLSQRREAEAQARAEAEAAFRGYASGIQPAAAAGWTRYLNTTSDRLGEQPGFTFVHLIRPDGRVLTSSDEEIRERGRVDERADWALAATELVTRPGAEDGILELAAPIEEGGRPVAHLWIGYDLGIDTELTSAGTLPPNGEPTGD